MLYRITPSMTTDNFSAGLNEEISLNDQRYSHLIYEKFFDHDYQNCTRNINLLAKDSERQLECYNTWYLSCMAFVRDEPLQEYLYYLWIRDETLVDPYGRQPIYCHLINGMLCNEVFNFFSKIENIRDVT